jgi:hypothetical protein
MKLLLLRDFVVFVKQTILIAFKLHTKLLSNQTDPTHYRPYNTRAYTHLSIIKFTPKTNRGQGGTKIKEDVLNVKINI